MDHPLCSACSAPLADDQRYCLACGERCDEARLDPLALARGPAIEADGGAADGQWRGLPRTRWIATAALATLVAGAALGAAAGPGTPASALAAAAASAEPVIVALAPAPLPAPAAPEQPVEDEPAEPPLESTPLPEPEVPVVTPVPEEAPAPDEEPEPAAPAPRVPPIEHVWLIVLTGHGYEDAFRPPPAAPGAPAAAAASPYLATELPAEGTLLSRYSAPAEGSLANGIALISGRKPSAALLAGCPPPQRDCMYPPDVPTLAGQLTGAGLTWRAYVEAAGSVPPDTPVPCDQLNPRNPFVYFRSVTESPECGPNLVGLDRLAPDLAAPDQTPAFSYIVPSACHDGTDTPCAEDAPAGLAATEPWLRSVIAQITATKAYRTAGLVVVTFDDQPGDGQGVGALLLSPFVDPGAIVPVTTGHLSLLRTIEDAFGLTHLGLAAEPWVHPLGPGVFKRWSPNVHAKTTSG